MADDPTKDPKAGGTGGAPAGDGGGIKAAVREVLAELGIGGAKKEEAAPAGDIASQVAEAVRQVREGDEAARKRAAEEAAAAEAEAAKKTPEPEQKPAENRWIERVMGWVEQ